MNAINLITIFALIIAVMLKLQANYISGLRWVIMIIMACPESLSLDFGNALPSFSIQRIMIGIATFFWLMKQEIRVPPLREIPFLKPQIFIGITFLLATFLAPDILVSAKRYGYFMIESLLLFMVIQTSIKDEPDAEQIIWGVGLGVAIAAAFGYVEKYAGFRIVSLFPSSRGDYFAFGPASYSTAKDIISVYKHRILFGTACSVGCIVFLMAAVGAVNKTPRRKSLVLFMFCAGALYLSFSRGPWTALAAAIMFMLPLMWRRAIRVLASIMLVAFLVLITHPGMVITFSQLGKETADPTNIKGSSFRWRFAVMNRAVSEIENAGLGRQIFGFGGGSHVLAAHVGTVTSNGKVLPMESWDCEFAINLYEMGIAGFIGLAALYGSIFRRVGGEIYRTHGDCPWPLTAAFGLIIVMFISKISVSLYTEQLVCVETVGIAVASRLLQPFKRPELSELEEEFAT
jgi:hypothetical protein